MNLISELRKSTVLGLALASLSTCSVFANNIGMVTADNVNLRSSNSTESAVISIVNNGEKVSILSDLNGWFKISSPSFGEAYVTSQYVKVAQADGEVNSNSVNIRTSPSTEGAILGQAAMGDLLSVHGVSGDWYEIDYKGTKAYVNKDFIAGDMLKYVPDIKNNNSVGIVTSPNQSNSNNTNVYAVVNCAEGINLRTEPSTSSSIIRPLSNGSVLDVYDVVNNGWVKVKDNAGNTGYVSSEFVALNNGTRPQEQNTASSKGTQLIQFAKQFIGTPYVYGGTSLTSGVDCSGFVYSVYKNFGITLNRDSRGQFQNGTQVAKSALVAGDLVFFNAGGNTAISHVGIYMGDGNYIHSTDGKGNGVTITPLNSSYSARTYVSARRIF